MSERKSDQRARFISSIRSAPLCASHNFSARVELELGVSSGKLRWIPSDDVVWFGSADRECSLAAPAATARSLMKLAAMMLQHPHRCCSPRRTTRRPLLPPMLTPPPSSLSFPGLSAVRRMSVWLFWAR